MIEDKKTEDNPFGFVDFDPTPVRLFQCTSTDRAYNKLIGQEGTINLTANQIGEFYYYKGVHKLRQVVMLRDLAPINVKNKDYKDLLKK